ncbi:HAD family hydrolase [Zwartia sp.]|uniref:HAD family hydrolase n=1 Tax=Zwartia sp. TaxID=2978004 RepID=UPI003BAE59DE
MNHLAPLLLTKDAIVFDLDGTLLHTEPDIRMAINAALAEYGHRTIDPSLELPNLHGPSRELIGSAVALVDFPQEDLDTLIPHFQRHYKQQAHAHSHLYPGVRELLEHLRDRDYKLAICTNKVEVNARHALQKTGIIDFFQVITGSDTTAFPKPHPLPLSHTLKELDVVHEKAVLIGDTHVDGRCAARCNVDFILHQNGYGRPHEAEIRIAGQFKTYGGVFAE